MTRGPRHGENVRCEETIPTSLPDIERGDELLHLGLNLVHGGIGRLAAAKGGVQSLYR